MSLGKASTVRYLLKDDKYLIEYYQRGYCWGSKIIRVLIADKFLQEHDPSHPLKRRLYTRHDFNSLEEVAQPDAGSFRCDLSVPSPTPHYRRPYYQAERFQRQPPGLGRRTSTWTSSASVFLERLALRGIASSPTSRMPLSFGSRPWLSPDAGIDVLVGGPPAWAARAQRAGLHFAGLLSTVAPEAR